MLNIKLNLIKTINHKNNNDSKLLLESLNKNNNLQKINWTTKKMENNKNEKPYLSYDNKYGEVKLYDLKIINDFLNKIDIPTNQTTIVYDTMME